MNDFNGNHKYSWFGVKNDIKMDKTGISKLLTKLKKKFKLVGRKKDPTEIFAQLRLLCQINYSLN